MTIEDEADPGFKSDEAVASSNAQAISNGPIIESPASTVATEVAPQSLVLTFAQTFLGVLLNPVLSFQSLAQPVGVAPQKAALSSAFLLVLLSCAIFQFAQAGFSAPFKSIVSVVSTDALLWISVAGLIRYLSHWRTEQVDFSRALVVTGWAFIPLLLSGPAVLLSYALHESRLLLHITILAFLIFQAIAASQLLKLDRVKMTAMIFVLPPLFVFVYLFWFSVGMALLLSSLTAFVQNHPG